MVTGDEICTHCGLAVAEQVITTEPEWRSSPDDDGDARADSSTGLDITRHDLGQGSTFEIPSDGGISPEYRETLRRMHFTPWDTP